MWCDNLSANESWTSLWDPLVICPDCGAIRSIAGLCPSCGDPMSFPEERTILDDGNEEVIPTPFVGAEGRYEDYVYLAMLEREWKRPIDQSYELIGIPETERPSPRAAIVLLFWTYFETRIERLLRTGMRNIPSELAEDALRRYSFIGARLERFYKILFG